MAENQRPRSVGDGLPEPKPITDISGHGDPDSLADDDLALHDSPSLVRIRLHHPRVIASRTSTKLCYYFQLGQCTQGSSCRWTHPTSLPGPAGPNNPVSKPAANRSQRRYGDLFPWSRATDSGVLWNPIEEPEDEEEAGELRE